MGLSFREFVVHEAEDKLDKLLEDDFCFFFVKNGKIYGAPEESRLVFARMKIPDQGDERRRHRLHDHAGRDRDGRHDRRGAADHGRRADGAVATSPYGSLLEAPVVRPTPGPRRARTPPIRWPRWSASAPTSKCARVPISAIPCRAATPRRATVRLGRRACSRPLPARPPPRLLLPASTSRPAVMP